MDWTERLTRRLRTLARSRTGYGDRNINVAGRSNVVVSSNLGHPGASHAASSSQSVRIRQRSGGSEAERDADPDRTRRGETT
jgi:hypothetical protein